MFLSCNQKHMHFRRSSTFAEFQTSKTFQSNAADLLFSPNSTLPMYDAVSKQRLMKFSESNNRENPLNLGVSIVCLSVRPSSYRLVDEAGNKTENGPCHVVEVARHNRERPWDKMIRYTKIGAFFEGHSIASLLRCHHTVRKYEHVQALSFDTIWHIFLQFTYMLLPSPLFNCMTSVNTVDSWYQLTTLHVCTIYWGWKTITDLGFLMNWWTDLVL